VRRWAEQVALDMLRRHLQGEPIPQQVGPATRVAVGGDRAQTRARS
jgi:hypothetical protein